MEEAFFCLFSLSPWTPSAAKTVTCKILGVLIFFFWGVRSPKCTFIQGPEQPGIPWDGAVCLASCCLVLGILSPGMLLLGVTASKHYRNYEQSEYGPEKWGGERKLEKCWLACCRVSVFVSGLSLKPWGVLGLLWGCREKMGHWGAELKPQTAWTRLLNLKPKRKQQKCVKSQKTQPTLL